MKFRQTISLPPVSVETVDVETIDERALSAAPAEIRVSIGGVVAWRFLVECRYEQGADGGYYRVSTFRRVD